MKDKVLKYLGIGIVFFMLFIVLFGNDIVNLYKEIGNICETTKMEIPNINIIRVEIKGAVHRPGVYEIYEDACLNDLLLLAKPLDKADTSNLNLAKKVSDGESYYIPYLKEESKTTTNNIFSNITKSEIFNLININTASLEELLTLPGIGEVKANKIIKYLKDGNKITSYSKLVEVVGGINDEYLEQIKTKTTLE